MSIFAGIKSTMAQLATAGPWRSVMIPIGIDRPSCPYCGHDFGKMPQRKASCSACNKVYYSRKRPTDDVKVLLTEQEAVEHDDQCALLECVHEARIPDSTLNGIVSDLNRELGRTPSTSELLIRQLQNQAEGYASEWKWGLYRNARLRTGDAVLRQRNFIEALSIFLEVCLLDLNGPRNCASSDPKLRKKYPAFEPSRASLPPAIVGRVTDAALPLRLTTDDVELRFKTLGASVAKRLGLPKRIDQAWTELRGAISLDTK